MDKSLLFTYAMTYGGAFVSLFRPWIGLLIYTCFAIIKPDDLWHWAVPPGNYSRIVAIALLIGWALGGCGTWKLGRARGVMGCLFCFWGILLIGSITGRSPERAWERAEQVSKAFLPIVVAVSLVDSWAKLRQYVWVIVLSQGFLAYEFNLTYYTTIFISHNFIHGGLDNNGIAITMVTGVGLAFFLGMHAPTRWQQALAMGCAGLMAHVVLFSNSRGGMVALIITGASCFLLVPKTPKHYLVFFLAFALVMRLAGAGVQERFLSIFQEKGTSADADGGGRRVDNWKACIDSMLKRPLGVGTAAWPDTAPEYGLPKMAAHSTWLQVGAELGFMGLGCLMGYYLLCIRRLLPYTRDSQPVEEPWVRCIARMVISALVGFFISAQFVSIEAVELPYFVVLLGAGTLKLLDSEDARSHPDPDGLTEGEEQPWNEEAREFEVHGISR